MRTAFEGLTTREIQQVRMYGCTEAQMREAVEQSITYRFSGPAMMAASLMSDAQEMINLEDRKSTRLNSSHSQQSRMPSSA